MAHSLDMYGRADAASALDPVGRSLFADEKRQDKQYGKSIECGMKADQTFGFKSYRNTAVLCKYRCILANWAPKESLELSELWRLVLTASSGVTVLIFCSDEGEVLE
jgi:hypothetical protein